MRKLLLLLLFLVGVSAAPDSLAAAWTQAKGKKQVILTVSGYESSRFYNDQEDSKKSSVAFKKLELNPFFEYGLTEDITVGISPTIQSWSFDKSVSSASIYDFRQCGIFNNSNTTRINTYMAEAEIFARAKFWEKDGFVFSVQPAIKTPCLFVSNGAAQLIENTMDLEMRILGGYSFKSDAEEIFGLANPFAGQYHFLNLEAAYRRRNKQFADQIRIDSTVGFRLSEYTLIMGQLFSTFSNGEEPVKAVFDFSGDLFVEEDSFYAVKLQLSAVKKLTQTTSLQFGLFKEIMGKNAGNGTGASVALWFSF